MTKREYLYTVLAEEAAEVQQAVSKILRFGEKAYCPDDEEKKDNEYLLLTEIEHLKTAVKMLQDNSYLTDFDETTRYEIQKMKEEKVNTYLKRHLEQQAFINKNLPNHPNYQGS